DPGQVLAPTWVGRILFRQFLAMYGRRDQGENRGPATRNRFALFRAALRFAWGGGRVPKGNALVPDISFAQVEATELSLAPTDADMLERYYGVKVASMQFFGAANLGLSFWNGLEALVRTFPIILWWARALAPRLSGDAVRQALSLVDYHYGFNPVF